MSENISKLLANCVAEHLSKDEALFIALTVMKHPEVYRMQINAILAGRLIDADCARELLAIAKRIDATGGMLS